MPKRILLLFLFFLSVTVTARATHIVGGEFEMQHLSGYNYKLSLNLYFDAVHGSSGAKDSYVSINVFSKASNAFVGRFNLSLSSVTRVPYTNIDCTVGELVTDKRVYTSNIYLDPNLYNLPEGYYITWERCCRNHTINNIIDPDAAAQVFYMEFPPVVKKGQFFQNSSPILFPPLSDYACVDQLFYYEFNGTDPDGDSLVYSMVTPLNGYTSADLPAYYDLNTFPPVYYVTPQPAPYPTVPWRPGYSTVDQIHGSPAINIDAKTGLLTMRPAQKGLFVFGVKIEEYRDGTKLGEVRREFQVLVLECPNNQAPQVMLREPDSKALYQEGQVLRINSREATRCMEILFTDPNLSEYVELRAKPVNFSEAGFTVSGPSSGIINQGAATDTLRATLCFEECFDTKGKVYQLDLIVKDDGCSLPKQDTVRLSFSIAPPPDSPPTLSLSTTTRRFEVRQGDQINFEVLGLDPDDDMVYLSATGRDFDMSSQNIRFESGNGAGETSSPFVWDITCETMKQQLYTVDFMLRTTVCGQETVRKETIEVVPVSDNQAPILSADNPALTYTLKLNEAFELNLSGLDIDQDNLRMEAAGEGFNLEEYGMQFTGSGTAGAANGKFTWLPACPKTEDEVLRVNFILQEENCAPKPQQLTVEFRVEVPKVGSYVPPNIFTPNGDGKNDFFEIPGLPQEFCSATFQNIRIYNRWGREVYRSTDSAFKWDGANLNDGVYFYMIDFNTTTYKGSVTLVR
ncbi:gliding motility-associated C-terminal domain-containing protein [Pontibacter mangrovi]|uniref:Gliding motility-associated C-terminal domain-containing protein n=1 Tax=Pontibacter mangrovi TaxID=2589816 RepID=A0A501WG96_9BACT|nr:gliding motility-associated C-terminal domain-containing protein [Pontibacter mangrovi]TPE46027.1 gliding motility-associated C-terminal domain-containing protein [Pontibacter mangrovi]